jgi:hypothetical protein
MEDAMERNGGLRKLQAAARAEAYRLLAGTEPTEVRLLLAWYQGLARHRRRCHCGARLPPGRCCVRRGPCHAGPQTHRPQATGQGQELLR